jgi:hypothetical protein
MPNIYYEIWADAIQVTKKNDSEQWKAATLIPMSVIEGINLLALLLLLRIISNGELPVVMEVKLTHISIINYAVSILLTFFLPFVLLNYLLIFYNDRYQQITNFYKGKNGRLYLRYVLASLGVIVVPLVIKLIF